MDMTSSETEMGRVSHWINGRIVEGTSGRHGAVYNPATGIGQLMVDAASAKSATKTMLPTSPGSARDRINP